MVVCDLCLIYLLEAIDCRLWLRQKVSGLLQRRSGFELVPVHVGFILDRMTLGQVLIQVLQLSSGYIYQFSILHQLHSYSTDAVYSYKRTVYLNNIPPSLAI